MSQLFIAQYSEECVFSFTCLLQVERFSPPQSLIASRESGVLIIFNMVQNYGERFIPPNYFIESYCTPRTLFRVNIYNIYKVLLKYIYIKKFSLKINIFGQSCRFFKKTSFLMNNAC